MKQIQILINQIVRRSNLATNKDQKMASTNAYLAQQRQRFVADTPIGFKPRSGSDYFLQS